ncbi:MAG: hypothetical protein M3003_16355 [Candidatus Dormibacteraeota bacterium]|nr:hypothetical protein [Candidatus Dormibacteraeota bacterium]
MAIAKQDGQRYRELLDDHGWLMPLPRYLVADMGDDELAQNIKEQYELRRSQMLPRIIMDMRDLRFFDPEKLQDQWQNYWTGIPLKKLSKARGRAIEIFPWVGPIGEAGVGLLSGHKPFAYVIDIPPEDPDSEGDTIQADAIEQWLYRDRVRQKYDLTYMDGVAWTLLMGRHWKMVTTDPDTRHIRTELLWPGHVAAFWQGDQRTLEQVIVARELTLGEAIGMYAPNWVTDPKQAILKQDMEGAVETWTTSDTYTGRRSLQRNAHVTLLTQFSRLGAGHLGDQVATATTLLGAKKDGSLNSVMVERHNDGGFEDIPLYCTPRFKIMDKPPDEATGIIRRIAGAQTEFNEVFSAARDMLNRAIYPRLKAKGFSYRNAPRFIRQSGMYALPREHQDIQRIEETLNTVPVEQILTRLEDFLVMGGGLNKFFISSSQPPNEASSDAIDAALNAAITRIEPTRNEIQASELWLHHQWLAQGEKWGSFDFRGTKYELSKIIEGKRDAILYWADMVEIGKTKRQQMALAARNAGVMSDDYAMDIFGIRSKVDERRKIKSERQDPILHPEHVSQTASAMIQMAQAEMRRRELAEGQPPTPIPTVRYNIALAGQLSPDEVQHAAEGIGIQGVAAAPTENSSQMPGRQPGAIKAGIGNATPVPGEPQGQVGPQMPPVQGQPGIPQLPPGRPASPPRAAVKGGKPAYGTDPSEVARLIAKEQAATAAARGGPPSFENNNQPGGALPGQPPNTSGSGSGV